MKKEKRSLTGAGKTFSRDAAEGATVESILTHSLWIAWLCILESLGERRLVRDHTNMLHAMLSSGNVDVWRDGSTKAFAYHPNHSWHGPQQR